MTTRHKVTIPKAVRDALGIGALDHIQFLLDAGGAVRVRKALSRNSLLGVLETSLAAEWASAADDAAFVGL